MWMGAVKKDVLLILLLWPCCESRLDAAVSRRETQGTSRGDFVSPGYRKLPYCDSFNL